MSRTPATSCSASSVCSAQRSSLFILSSGRVDELRISRSEVSRICEGLDEQVHAFRSRSLEGRYPYLFVDAKVEKVRDAGRVQRECVVVAHGVHETRVRRLGAPAIGVAQVRADARDERTGGVWALAQVAAGTCSPPSRRTRRARSP